jgi:hypothetical protein
MPSADADNASTGVQPLYPPTLLPKFLDAADSAARDVHNAPSRSHYLRSPR